MTVNKKELLELCKEALTQSRKQLLSALEEISESLTQETKSSVGDKHETARARMQFEQEKLGTQVQELNEQEKKLEKIDANQSNETIGFGSLVETDSALFFIAIALGKIQIKSESVHAISIHSPLAQKMKGLKKGEKFEMNTLNYWILAVH